MLVLLDGSTGSVSIAYPTIQSNESSPTECIYVSTTSTGSLSEVHEVVTHFGCEIFHYTIAALCCSGAA